MARFTLTPEGPFSLAAGTRFLEGFAPAAYTEAADTPLDLAFAVDGDWRTVGVRVHQEGNEVVGDVVLADGAVDGKAEGETAAEVDDGLLAAVRTQVGRILSLDVDGSGFADVGRRDPVVGRLQDRYPGLRPVCFWSPYEAAAWTLIGRRTRIPQAAAIKARMAVELGRAATLGDRVVHAFPAPERLAELEAFGGLAGRKPEWLRALGEAALRGELDAATLRALPRDEALAQLGRLGGIGPFSAELVQLRG